MRESAPIRVRPRHRFQKTFRAAVPTWLLILAIPLAGCNTDGIGAAQKHFESTPTYLANLDAATLVGAGDIGLCGTTAPESTARILDTIPGIVFTTGDGAYHWGTAGEYAECYHTSWGRHKARTRPASGDNDYESPAANGYFGYYQGAAGNPGTGYYTYHINDWFVIVLNTFLDIRTGTRQLAWLKQVLEKSDARCTIAVFHKPRFSSGEMHGSNAELDPIWRALYQAGTDVVINGHEHGYERFAPQTPDAVADPERGIRQFVVGTGGGRLSPLGAPIANSEVRSSLVHGVLMLKLGSDSYDWHFVPTEPNSFTDSGSDRCH